MTFEYRCTMTVDGKRCTYPVRRQLSEETYRTTLPKSDAITFDRSLCEDHLIILPALTIHVTR